MKRVGSISAEAADKSREEWSAAPTDAPQPLPGANEACQQKVIVVFRICIFAPEAGDLVERRIAGDTTFESHYSIADLAKRWRLGCETVRLLVKDERVS